MDWISLPEILQDIKVHFRQLDQQTFNFIEGFQSICLVHYAQKEGVKVGECVVCGGGCLVCGGG